METPTEIELAQKKISSLFQDPLCKILMEKSFFTEIQLETLLIDLITYQATEPRITQSTKAQSRQRARGRTRGSYNRVLLQTRLKLEKTLYSMLLLGYLGILGDVRSSMFIEASRKMQEYLELRHRRSTKTNSTAEDSENIRKSAEMEANLREQLHQTLSGMRPVTP